jgi:predicted XRE-type DNA-binding protein
MADIWDKAASTTEEALNLRVRSQIMMEILYLIEQKKWKQREAARATGLTPPRVNDLVHGKISKFSLDALFKIMASLDMKPNITIEWKQ